MANQWDAGWLRSALTLAVLAGVGGGAAPAVQTPPKARPPAPKTVRLYVFDCGLLNITSEGVQRYHVTPADVGETRMSVPCFRLPPLPGQAVCLPMRNHSPLRRHRACHLL